MFVLTHLEAASCSFELGTDDVLLVQEKGNIDVAIRYYLIAIEVCKFLLPYLSVARAFISSFITLKKGQWLLTS